MVTKARAGQGPVSASTPNEPKLPNGVITAEHAEADANGTAPKPEAQNPAATPSQSNPPQPPGAADANGQATATGEVKPPEAAGQAAAAEADEQRKREDSLVAEAQRIRALRAMLALAKEEAWKEPQRPLSHWSFVMKEAIWLATDFSQERLWKMAAARRLARDAARWRKTEQLKPADGAFGEEVRAAIAASQAPQEDPPSTRRGGRASTRSKPSEDPIYGSIEADEIAPGTPPREEETVFHYAGSLELMEATELQLRNAADEAAIQQEMAIREYEVQYERSLREAQEAAAALRRQMAAELRGREVTPLGEFEDDYGKKSRRKKARPSWDEFGGDADALPASKRVAGLRKQQLSRPDSTYSDERRDIDAGVETSGRRERESRRKRKLREYDDEDYEEPLRNRELTKRKPPMDRDRRTSLRTHGDQRNLRSLSKRGSGLGMRHSSRGLLDGDGFVSWSPAEDSLLCSIVHEFGVNWRLVSDIFSTSNALAGIYRSPVQCRTRFRELGAPHTPEGQEMQEQAVLEAMRVNKTSARDLINKSLPAPDAILQLHHKVLLQLALATREKRQRARQQEKQNGLRPSDTHPTILAAQEQAIAANRGVIATPLQLIEAADAQAQALAAQQLAAQQAAAAHQAQAAAAAAAAPGMPGVSGAASVAPPATGANPGLPPDQAGSVARQGSITSQPQGGQPNPGQPSPGAQGMPGIQAGGGMGPPGFAGGSGQPMAPPAAMTQQQPRGLSVAQLQQILSSGRLPNGAELSAHQRAQLVARMQSLRANVAASRGVQPAGVPGMQPGMAVPPQQPGMPHGQHAGALRPQMQQLSPPLASGHVPGMSPTQMGGGQMPPGQALGSAGLPQMGMAPGRMPGMAAGSPGKQWPGGMGMPRGPQMQQMRPGMGMPGMSQPVMSQAMQAGMNPAMAQAQGRPPMPGVLPQQMQPPQQ